MMRDEVIGRVTGDSRSNMFVFSTDPSRPPQLYEYVYVRLVETPPGSREAKSFPVLAQVVDIKRVGMAFSPGHPWSVVREVPDNGIQDLVVATARVLGYKYNGRIYYPRHAPPVGSWVYRAPDKLVESFYEIPEKRALHIGSLISRPSVPVYLDLKGIERHLAIIAATGSGKTWTSIVLIEELLKKGATILVLDPHGEYVRMRETIHRLGPEYRDRVLVLKGHRNQEGDILYRISVLRVSGEELSSVAGVPSNASRVRAVVSSARNIAVVLAKATGAREFASIKGIISIIEAGISSATRLRGKIGHTSWDSMLQVFIRELAERIGGFADKLIQQPYRRRIRANFLRLLLAVRRDPDPAYDAIRYLEELNRIGVYGSKTVPLRYILRPSHITVFNLSGLRSEVQDHLVYDILSRVFEARVRSMRGLEGEKFEYPVVVVLEEAHRFAPPKHLNETWSYWIVQRIAGEGRKFGVYLVVITQRPSKVDSDVLSQCQSQIILRIINPKDQEAVREAGEQVSQEILNNLPGLNTGEAVVLGPVAPAPLMIRVRDRILEYAGTGPSLEEEMERAYVEASIEASIEESLSLALSHMVGERVYPGKMTRNILSGILGLTKILPRSKYYDALRLLARGRIRTTSDEEIVYARIDDYEVVLDTRSMSWRCSCGSSSESNSICSHVVAVMIKMFISKEYSRAFKSLVERQVPE